MVNYKNSKDTGTKSGVVYCGKIQLDTLDKLDWLTIEIDDNGNLRLVNHSGQSAVVTLS